MLTCRNIHDEAMTGLTATETARVLAAYDSSQFRMIVDIRGGNGAFLAALLSQQLKATGILAELPHVVSLAPGVLQQAGVVDRCEMVGCDFFETVRRLPAPMIARPRSPARPHPLFEVFSQRYERGSIIVTTSGESGIATASGRRTDRHPASRSPCGRRFRLTERR
jgi:hypothetical protein